MHSTTVMAAVSPTPVLPSPVRQRGWRAHAIRFILALAIVLAVQTCFRAFSDDFSGTADEPSHFLNGLLARDYAAAALTGSFRNPMDFAIDYYLHYPKVAIGNWPPGYPAISGLWMLITGPGRFQALILIALFAAASATVLWAIADDCLAPVPAAVSVGSFVLLAPAADHTLHVVLEWPLTFFGLLAAFSAARAIRTGSHGATAVLGLSLGAAVMIKGNAWALVPATVGALAATRRLRVLWNWQFALAGLTAFGLAAGFYLLTLQSSTHVIKTRALDWPWISGAVLFYILAISRHIGLPYIMLATIGAIAVTQAAVRKRDLLSGCDPVWIVSVWWIAATFLFHIFVTIGPEWRYLCLAAPFVALFAGRGFEALIAANAPSSLVRLAGILMAVILVAATLAGTVRLPSSARGGFRLAAQEANRLLSASPNKALLVAGDSIVEGRATAEIALTDRGRQIYVLRGSKILASDDWMGRSYRPLFATAREAAAEFDRIPISVVVLSRGDTPRVTHESQIEEIVTNPAFGWNLHKRWNLDYGRAAETIEIYWNPANASRPIQSFRVDLSQKLGRSVEYSPGRTLR